ncbi:MAG: type II toxin-antitoxin system VapC family toxin [Verrucomicrobiota bacterium]
MRILVDSHIAVWWLSDPQKLRSSARSAIADPQHQVYLSAASVWELSIKIAKGKLSMPLEFVEILEADGFLLLPITTQHALATSELPPHHNDPFDRMLVAQARVDGMMLATSDDAIFDYDVSLLRS